MCDYLNIASIRPMMDQLQIIADRAAHIVANECSSHRELFKITAYSTSINDCKQGALEQESLCKEHFKRECPWNSAVEITALAELEGKTGKL